MKLIDRYILKAHVGPFFFAFLTIIFVLILQFFASFADRFIGRGIGFGALVELIALQSAWMVGLAAPMAVLIAVVMAFGALTTTSEMTVFRASGVSLYRLMIPILLAGLVLSFFVERFNNVVQPLANYQARSLMDDIVKAKPNFGITENAFSPLVDGYSILVRKSDERTGGIGDIIIYDSTRPDFRSVITAEEGRISFSDDGGYLLLTLRNGEIHEVQQPDYRLYRKMSFQQHRYVFESTGFGFSRSDDRRNRAGGKELSAKELLLVAGEYQRKVDDSEKHIGMSLEMFEQALSVVTPAGAVSYPQLKSPNAAAASAVAGYLDRQITVLQSELKNRDVNQGMVNRFMAEYHKKYALAFACFFFVLVGAPLGILARRGGFGIGAILSLFFFVLYWILMIAGEKMAVRGVLEPWAAIWMADAVMAAIGLTLVISLTGAVFNSNR
ncbi:YjgP/YjgQ family permease [Chlorobium phaeovibrioides]|uniref:YjgP/YjgQ family permease n=1 Tax=Chlorobium phaeovibrioides TaxID=1094 RepID=A0A3S0N9K8_CHLPH|nr:LptF/LptG family permease [Chlorobium phaeovibrioides]RTY36324.1 YjgP/YjgQ family permease [Chlorobium phaeovibrioides]